MAARSRDHDPELLALIANYVDQRLAPRAASFTTPLLWPNDGGLPELVGTCLAVRIGEYPILLTAGHVLDLADERPLAIVVDNELREIRGEVTRFRPVPERAAGGDHIDVGAVILTPECTPNDLLSLVDLQLIIPPHAPVDAYMVMGYPCSRNRDSLQGEQFRARLYHFLTKEASTEGYRTLDRDPADQIVLHFNRKDVWRPEGRFTAPNLNGISGGGVWHLAPESGIPLPQAELAAIAVEWHDKARVKHVLSTRIRPLVAELAHRYPGIRDAVAAFVRDTRLTRAAADSRLIVCGGFAAALLPSAAAELKRYATHLILTRVT